jgi:lambda family phage portal protein
MAAAAVQLNWWDRTVAYFSAGSGIKRIQQRRMLAALDGYEAANPSRRRKFANNRDSGETLARKAAMPLRDQARDLDRNHDIVTGIIDKLVDFTIGSGIQIEAQPRRRDGSPHTEFAERLMRHYAKWSEWPEVTWTHDRGAAERLLMASAIRDGEAFSQVIEGPRNDGAHGSELPLSLELIEADLVPLDLDEGSVRQGIERNAWNRPVAYHVYKQHPGDTFVSFAGQDTKRVAAERMTHVRFVRRIGQLRGISLLAPVLTRLRDVKEYEDDERMAAKMAAEYVFKWTRGSPDMASEGWDPTSIQAPPMFRMDGGMIIAGGPGEGLDAVDTKRPNSNADPFVTGQLRRVAAGVGLSASAVTRNYNGTYSAQRQELVECWPHYAALTAIFVSQHTRHVWQRFVTWEMLTYGVPLDLDLDTAADALFLGPPMPWINPVDEAEANILLVQAAFKTSAQVMRERGGSLTETYRQLGQERRIREEQGVPSTLDQSVSQAGAAAADSTPAATSRRVLRLLKQEAA